MSSTIKQAIEALKGRIADAYTAVSAKGGTLPATQDSANLPTAIASIPSGGGGSSFLGIEIESDNDGALVKLLCDYNIYNNTLKEIDDSTVVTIRKVYAFERCSGLKSAKFSLVTSVSDYAFTLCTSLEEINMPSVTIVGRDFVSSCSSLVSVSLPLLKNANGMNTFANCSALQTLSLPALETMTNNYNFVNDGLLEELHMPSCRSIYATNQFNNCNNLICIEIGSAMTGNFSLQSWNPTEALRSDIGTLVRPSETFANNLEKLLYNIREHIAANLPDRTGQSALTITFHANIKAAINADTATAQAFSNKNWTIA